MRRLLIATTAAVSLMLTIWASPAGADDCHTVRIGGFNSPQVCGPIPGGLK